MLDLESLDIADTDYTMFPRTFADGTTGLVEQVSSWAHRKVVSVVHPRSHFGQSRVCHEGLPCLPLADVYEVVSSKTTVFIMYIQVSQWHPPLIREFFVVVAVIAVAALMLLLLYTCSLQLQFFDIYRPLSMTTQAMRCLICLGVLLSRKKNHVSHLGA